MGSSHTSESSFRSLLLRHRGRTGLIQRVLAGRVGASLRSLQDWESGVSLPTAERLQGLVRALLEAGSLTVGSETLEARELWAAAEREAPRMRTPFDVVWFAGVLAAQESSTTATSGAAERPTGKAEPAFRSAPEGARAQDWGEAPDTANFVGRAEEIERLRGWVLGERCRLVAVLGMGGIGKTSLAARLAETVSPSFERVYWRSLRNAPPVDEWLAGAISFVSDQQVVPPLGESERITALLQLLRTRRCLLVLDNSETLFEPGQQDGRYRAGLDGYGRVVQAVGESSHQSCLMLTSREAPPELALVGRGARSVEVHGLASDEAQRLLADKQLIGDAEAWASLVYHYGGNGLAMKIAGETIRQVYDGHIAAFVADAIADHGIVFGDIRRLLDAQAERLSPIEQDVLTRIAVEREPISLAELSASMPSRVRGNILVEAIETLRRRSLVERGEGEATHAASKTPRGMAFTLQSMVLEYVTDRLVETAADEIGRGEPVQLVEQPLIKAHARDFVRQAQERLIGGPILQRLGAEAGDVSAESRLLALLERWRGRPTVEQGYGPGNVVNLLRVARGDLRGMDLSRLSLRQAYLAEVNAQDASLAGADLADSVLAEGFDLPGSIALSSSGSLLAAGTATGRVWLWHVGDRSPLLTVGAHTGVVRGVAISRDERLMASGGVDATISLWDTATGQRLATLQGHTMGIRSVALSADGQLLSSGGDDGTVRLWNTAARELRATLQGHVGVVWGVALSADGRLTASGGADRTVRVWDSDSGQLRTTLHGHDDMVRSVALSADGRLVVSCADDATVRVWNAQTGQHLGTLRGHNAMVMSLALSADGRLAATASFDRTLRLWDVERLELVAILHGHLGTVIKAAVSADGRIAASASNDGSLRLWDVSAKRLITTLQGHPGGIWRVALSEAGTIAASAGADGSVRVWGASNGQPVATLHGEAGMVRAVAMSGDGEMVASGALDGRVRFWEVRTGRVLASPDSHTGGVRCLSLSGDGQRMASCGDDATVRVWSVALRKPMYMLQGHTGTVWDVALSRDGRILASGANDGTVMLWDVMSGQLRITLRGHAGGVHGVALCGNGALVVSCGVDTSVRVWDTNTGNLISTLLGHSGDVWDVAVSTDGRLVASSSDDGTIRIWDTQSGACLRSLWSDRLYQRLDITGLTGTTHAQRAALLALGALESSA